MNCTHCGAPISLEEKFCPNCGQPNEAAAQHSRDMENYKREFEKTRSGVLANLKAYKGITARLMIFLVVLVLMIIAFIAMNGVYEIHRNKMIKNAKAHSAEVSATLEEYMENKDYVMLAEYAEYNFLSSYKLKDDPKLGKYYPVIRVARCYEYFYMDVMKFITDENPSESTYIRTSIGTDVSEVYKYISDPEGRYLYDGSDKELVDSALADIEELTDAVLITYLGFDRSEVAEFKTLTDAKRAVVIEEKVDQILSQSK